jgi:hypothetical protein
MIYSRACKANRGLSDWSTQIEGDKIHIMDTIQTFLQSIAASVGPFVPRIVAAAIIFIGALVIARLIKAAVQKLGQTANLDGRLRTTGISDTLGNIGYWLVWLLALPILLSTLGLTGLLDPVNNLLNRLLGFLPNLFGAVVVLAVGYLVARIVRQIVTSLLTAAGSERLAARLGMVDTLGKDGLAGLAGSALFVLMMLPVITAALQPLGLDSVTRPIANMLDTITALIPKLVAVAVIVVLAVVVGRIIANIVSSVLTGLGFDRLPTRLGMATEFRLANRKPSELAGTVVLAGILIAALTQASEVLGFTALTAAIGTFGVVLAQVLTGLVVLGIGLWLANLAATALQGSTLPNSGTLSRVARIAILFFTIPLALRQMGLPTEIITIGFGSIMAALTIGAAIAIGIGGRHAAGRVVEHAVQSLEEGREHALQENTTR